MPKKDGLNPIQSNTKGVEKSNTPVSKALEEIAESLRKLSGYPENTIEDSGMAFAYGLMIGTAFALKKEFEGKEIDNDATKAASEDQKVLS